MRIRVTAVFIGFHLDALTLVANPVQGQLDFVGFFIEVVFPLDGALTIHGRNVHKNSDRVVFLRWYVKDQGASRGLVRLQDGVRQQASVAHHDVVGFGHVPFHIRDAVAGGDRQGTLERVAFRYGGHLDAVGDPITGQKENLTRTGIFGRNFHFYRNQRATGFGRREAAFASFFQTEIDRDIDGSGSWRQNLYVKKGVDSPNRGNDNSRSLHPLVDLFSAALLLSFCHTTTSGCDLTGIC